MATSESKTLANLVKARGLLRTKVTKLFNKLFADEADISEVQRRAFVEKLDALRKQLFDSDKEIQLMHIDSDLSQVDLQLLTDESEEYEDRICEMSALLSSDRTSIHIGHAPPAVSTLDSRQGDKNRLKLPQVPMPEFSNAKGENFQKFIQGFEAIVTQHNLSDYAQFVYLGKQLSGPPKILIDSLDVDKQKYTEAKALLKKAFDSTLSSKYELLYKLSDINLPMDADPYPFIGEMRTIIAGLRSLEISVDDICQFFVWKGLNEKFQSHLVNITNKSKPSIDEINEHVFEATERYLKQIEKSTEQKTKSRYVPSYVKQNENLHANAAAVNIKPKKLHISCVLCTSDNKKSDHYLRECDVYSTSKAKFDKLRTIQACTKCSFRNHEAKNCTFKFRSPCFTCQGDHMSYLCLKPKKAHTGIHATVTDLEHHTGEDRDNEVHADTDNNLLLVEVAHSSINEPVILPTFTLPAIASNFEMPVRVFKDSGSQRTFVCESIVDRLKCEVLNDDVPLNIQGFNSNRKLRTKLVQLKVDINGEIFKVPAICVDRIRTKFNSCGIKDVATAFMNKGYKIADHDYLGCNADTVDNIDVIFGTDVDPILPLTYKSFGCMTSKSSYIDSPLGIVFSGDLRSMLENLSFLQSKNEGDFISNTIIAHPGDFSKEFSAENIDDIVCHDLTSFSVASLPDTEENDFVFERQGELLCSEYLNEAKLDLCWSSDSIEYMDDPIQSETNLKIIDYVMDNIKIDIDGRLIRSCRCYGTTKMRICLQRILTWHIKYYKPIYLSLREILKSFTCTMQ